MAFQPVAFGHEFAEVAWASIDVRHLMATAAMEMVVMVLVDLVAIRLAGQ